MVLKTDITCYRTRSTFRFKCQGFWSYRVTFHEVSHFFAVYDYNCSLTIEGYFHGIPFTCRLI